MSARPRFRSLAVAFLVVMACGPEEPPLEALLLRDALLSDPDVLASLSEERRRQLAERLEEVRAAQPESEVLVAQRCE